MRNEFPLPAEDRLKEAFTANLPSADRRLKALRYVVASVNDDALRAWGDLWKEFKDGVTPAGSVTPEMREGFKPSCGWAEFLEKFWLLKHYLDCTQRFCEEANCRST